MTTKLVWPSKDPDEVLDFAVEWSARLDGDTISTSAWTVPSGLVSGAELIQGTQTVVWLSAGVAGTTYSVLNRITTAAGRTMDQSVTLKIKDR